MKLTDIFPHYESGKVVFYGWTSAGTYRKLTHSEVKQAGKLLLNWHYFQVHH